MAEVISTHFACFNAMKDHPITKIPKLSISRYQVQKLRRELTAADMIISTIIGGGYHSHTFLLFSNENYKTFSGKNNVLASAQGTACPSDNPGLLDNDSSGITNRKTTQWSGKRSTYFYKEGVTVALRKLIIDKVP